MTDQPHPHSSKAEGKSTSVPLHRGFVDLPNELFTLIFDILDSPDLYNLLLLCRRINYLALPVYFSRQGVRNPSTSSIDATVRIGPNNFHLLPPVIASPPFMCCDTLSCEFSSHSTLLRDIHRLHIFLSKFLYIRKMTLDFHGAFDILWLFPDWQQSLKASLHNIFATVLEKSCEDLTVEYGFYFPGGQMLWPAEEGWSVRWRRILSRIGRHFIFCVPALLPFHEEEHSIPAPKFKIFNIHSIMLLRPPFDKWTIGILNGSTITTLSFKAGPALFSPDLWIKILPAITLPALSKLSIKVDHRSVSFNTASRKGIASSLSQFLLRHPSIIRFQCRGLPDPYGINERKKLCPQLESLEGSTGYLLYFLHPADSLPTLNHISMSPPPSGSFNFTSVETILAVIRPRTGSITLGITFPILPAFCTDHNVLNSWLRGRIGNSRSVEHFLHCVKKLELTVPIGGSDRYVRFYDGAVSLLPAWIALFPDIRYVEIKQCFLWASLATKVAFVQLLNQACPMVETVKLELEEHDILSWCSMYASIDGSPAFTLPDLA